MISPIALHLNTDFLQITLFGLTLKISDVLATDLNAWNLVSHMATCST